MKLWAMLSIRKCVLFLIDSKRSINIASDELKIHGQKKLEGLSSWRVDEDIAQENSVGKLTNRSAQTKIPYLRRCNWSSVSPAPPIAPLARLYDGATRWSSKYLTSSNDQKLNMVEPSFSIWFYIHSSLTKHSLFRTANPFLSCVFDHHSCFQPEMA